MLREELNECLEVGGGSGGISSSLWVRLGKGLATKAKLSYNNNIAAIRMPNCWGIKNHLTYLTALGSTATNPTRSLGFPRLIGWVELYPKIGILERYGWFPNIISGCTNTDMEPQLKEKIDKRVETKKRKMEEVIEAMVSLGPEVESFDGSSTAIVPRPCWAEIILDNLLKIQWSDNVDMLEVGLDRSKCELSNPAQWKPTFTAKVIQILVQDLVAKIKDLASEELFDTKLACAQAVNAAINARYDAKSVHEQLQKVISETNQTERELKIENEFPATVQPKTASVLVRAVRPGPYSCRYVDNVE
eukprot:Gb_02259 [translate_table: standard]